MNHLRVGVGNPSGLEEEGKYCGGVYVAHPGGAHVYANEDQHSNTRYENRSYNFTGEKEVGITGVLHSFDKMKVFGEHDTKPKSDQTEPKVYTGSHDQFAPEPVKNPPPLDTIAADPSNPNSSYSQRISTATSAIADKAAAVKGTLVSKLGSSTENKVETSPKTNTKSSFPTAFSHKVADTLSSTLGPVYEKVTSKMQGGGHDEAPGKGATVKEFLVDTFKPGDDDKVLSEAITHAFHRGKGNQPTQETTTTTYDMVCFAVVREEGERRLQESGN
ncbi:low-temperature-induced 65 kDa protein-like [Bidens hawaiensis]|uniref:low-temperature-induced 65 kDa protein-like n=1 Tax=Bidens hawaiensis TaxID=980011 RepID=UPI004048EB11